MNVTKLKSGVFAWKPIIKAKHVSHLVYDQLSRCARITLRRKVSCETFFGLMMSQLIFNNRLYLADFCRKRASMCAHRFACDMRAERQHTKHVFLYLNSLCNQADQLILVFSDAIFSHRKGLLEECRTLFEYRWSKENDTKLWGDRSH